MMGVMYHSLWIWLMSNLSITSAIDLERETFAAYRRGDWQSASKHLERYLQTLGNKSKRSGETQSQFVRMNYLAGQIAMIQGKWSDAIRLFEQGAKTISPIRDWQLYALGLAYFGAKQWQKAADVFGKLFREGGAWRERVRDRWLESLRQAENWQTSASLLKQWLRYPPSDLGFHVNRWARWRGEQQRWWWELLMAQSKLGDWHSASIGLRRFALIYAGDVRAAQAEDILRQWDREGKIKFRPWDEAEQQRRLIYPALFYPHIALKELDRWWGGLSAKRQSDRQLVGYRLLVEGQARFSLHQYDLAIAPLEKLLQDRGYALGLRQTAARHLGRLYVLANRQDRGQKLLSWFAEQQPGYHAAGQAIYAAAWLALQRQNYSRADELFAQYITRYPKSSTRRRYLRAHWYRAWCWFRQGRYREAIDGFKQVGQQRLYISTGRTLYWIARAYEESGDWPSAKQLYHQLVKAANLEYYSLLARQRLHFFTVEIPRRALGNDCLHKSLLANNSISWDSYLRNMAANSKDAMGGREVRLRSIGVSTEPEIPIWRDSKILEQSVADYTKMSVVRRENVPPIPSVCRNQRIGPCHHLVRARWLVRIGLEREAGRELYLGRQLLLSNARSVRDALRWLHAVGAHHEAVLLARESRIAPSVALSGREWMQIHYPLVFAPQVISHSRSVQVDPAWTWAIMREESLYKLRATSNAGAYGLMQVIPPTGAKIAQRLQLKNYQPQQLYEPDLSIRMGSWYLARLLQNYGQHILLASAAYNAGPHYVSAWLTHRYHLDFDVFVEEIFFTETREYTKRIFRSYAVYSQLYHQRLLGIVSSIKVNIVHNVDF